jgi:hypothetical protein
MVSDEVCGQRFLAELLTSFRLMTGLEPVTSPQAARSTHVLRTGSRCIRIRRLTNEEDGSDISQFQYVVQAGS